MKCENCGVLINPDFGFAIKNNQCPACGKNIMSKEKAIAVSDLKSLLAENIKGIDIDPIVSLVVANFDIKLISKNGLQKPVAQDKIDDAGSPPEKDDPDAEFKQKQKKEAQAILRKLRDEALNGALHDRYGFEEDGAGVSIDIGVNDGESTFEVAERIKKEQKRDAVLSGGGSFKRSE